MVGGFVLLYGWSFWMDIYMAATTTFSASVRCFLVKEEGRFPQSLDELQAHECGEQYLSRIVWFDLAEGVKTTDIDVTGWVESQQRYVVEFSGHGFPYSRDFRRVSSYIGQYIHNEVLRPQE